MGSRPVWQQLKDLAEIDSRRKVKKSQILEIKDKIIEDKKIIPVLKSQIEEINKEFTDAKKEVDIQELNAKDLKDREQEKRKSLDSVKNQKQYAAIEKEIESITKESAEHDDALINAWHKLESAKNKKETEIAKIQEKINTAEKEIEEIESKKEELNKELEKINEEKKEMASTVPTEWFTKYETMSGKVSDPVVPVINSSCSACYYSVLPQDMGKLKKSALLPCRSCYRLLYYNKEEEKDTKKASY